MNECERCVFGQTTRPVLIAKRYYQLCTSCLALEMEVLVKTTMSESTQERYAKKIEGIYKDILKSYKEQVNVSKQV